MKTTLIALAAFAMTGPMLASTPATAQELSVIYDDLDLTTQEGQRTLKKRIDTAARKICGFDSKATGTRLGSRKAERCYAKAKAEGRKLFAAIISAASQAQDSLIKPEDDGCGDADCEHEGVGAVVLRTGLSLPNIFSTLALAK